MLLTAHCSLLIANCSIRPQKKFPGAGPRAYRICNIVCKNRGSVPGKVSQGEAPEGCASPEEANPSKVFSPLRDQYIPPPMPPAGAAGAGVSSFLSATRDSVVRITEAIEAAFCSALRVTLVGSTMPLSTISQ